MSWTQGSPPLMLALPSGATSSSTVEPAHAVAPGMSSSPGWIPLLSLWLPVDFTYVFDFVDNFVRSPPYPPLLGNTSLNTLCDNFGGDPGLQGSTPSLSSSTTNLYGISPINQGTYSSITESTFFGSYNTYKSVRLILPA